MIIYELDVQYLLVDRLYAFPATLLLENDGLFYDFIGSFAGSFILLNQGFGAHNLGS